MTASSALDAELTIDTRLFGRLTLPPESIYHFANGLPGFADAQRWAVLVAHDAPVAWLQSIDRPDLAFLLTRPSQVHSEAWVDHPDAWVIVTLPSGHRPGSANLRAPVLLDQTTRTGRQFIPERCPWPVTAPVALEQLLGTDSRSGEDTR